jgi:hypothetical protein
MADNVAITAGTGTSIATDDIGGVQYQRVKPQLGADGSATDMLGGAGAVAAGVQRVTLASDDPAVAALATLNTTVGTGNTSLSVLDDWDETDRAKVNPIAGQAGVAAGAGAVSALTQRVTMASDDPMSAKLPASLGVKAAAASMSVTQSTEDAAKHPALGAAADAASIPVSLSTESKALLSAITTAVNATNTQLPATPSGVVQATITRPANTTPYTAGDVLGGAITLATGLTSGQNGMLLSLDLQGQVAAVPSGMTTFRLHLYNVTPPSALADNAVFDLPSGDRTAYLGYVTLTAPVDLGATIYAQTDALNRPFDLGASANLFAYLETVGGFTPAGNSEVYLLRAHFIGL